MIRMTHKLLVFLLLPAIVWLLPALTGTEIVCAQNRNIHSTGMYLEQTFAQTDRDYYVTGEFLRYGIFVFNPSAPGENVQSKILYISLFNQNLYPVLTWRSNFTGNISAGEIKLPDTLSSGVYYLAAYTSFMRSLPLSYIAFKPLFISALTDDNFTEFQVREIVASEAEGIVPEAGNSLRASEKTAVRGTTDIHKEASSIVNLFTEKDSIVTRGSLRVRINPGTLHPGETARVSVRIVRKVPFSFILSEGTNSADIDSSAQEVAEVKLPLIGEQIPPASAAQSTACRYVTENEGYLLSGTVSNPVTATPLRSKLVTLTVPDSVPFLDYSFTDSSGRFCFVLSPVLDNRSLCLQMLDGDTVRENINWQIDSKCLPVASGKAMTIRWNQEQIKAWDEIRSVGLINLVYALDSVPEHEKVTLPLNRPFYYTADRRVVPADFSPLDNFREVAENLLLSVRYRKKDENYFIRILEPGRQSFWPPDRRILLNGVFYDDLASLAGKGSKQIRYIDIVNRRLLFGDLTFNGLLSLVTTDGEIPPSYLARHACTLENKVYLPGRSFNTSNVPAYPLPDFRLGLYWNPDIRIHSDNAEEWVVHASDIPGAYRIEVCGITSSGRRVEVFKDIVVLENGSQHAEK